MKSNEKSSVIEVYAKELEKDSHIDRFNVMDKQMMLPAIKHKWVARLINHKKSKAKLKRLKEKSIQDTMDEIREKSDVALSKIALERMANKTTLIEGINKKIESEELCILYLEKVENIFRSMSYDLSNIVDLMKLEET